MKKLIALPNDHYIIVDDSEIKEGDSFYSVRNLIEKAIINYPSGEHIGKITHSTQPLEWFGGEIIFLSEVKELIGEVDVEKKAEKFIGCEYEDIEDNIDQIGYDSFIRGYNQALEDNKEKKYTKEDMKKVIDMARDVHDYGDNLHGFYWTEEDIIQSLQPKTEWEVEFIDGKLKLK